MRFRSFLLAFLLTPLSPAATDAAASDTARQAAFRFDIPAGSLETALGAFAQTTGTRVSVGSSRNSFD